MSTRQFVWTIRLVGAAEPFFWILHDPNPVGDGRSGLTHVESMIAKCQAAGHSVVVGFSRYGAAMRRSER
jgi:hypothetical protein